MLIAQSARCDCEFRGCCFRWLFQDWLGAANGLVDYTYQEKGGALAPERVRNFVDQVVVVLENGTLWDPGTFSAVYSGSLQPRLRVSNYAETNLSACAIDWKVSELTQQQQQKQGDSDAGSSHTLAAGVIQVGLIPQGTVMTVAEPLSITLPAVLHPMQFQLNVSLTCAELGATPRRNDWTAWAYPQPTQVQVPSGHRVFASERILKKVQKVLNEAQPLTNESATAAAAAARSGGGGDLYIVSQADPVITSPALTASIREGGKLLVLESPAEQPRVAAPNLIPFDAQDPVLFHSPWWTNFGVTPVALTVNEGGGTPEGFLNLSSSAAPALRQRRGRYARSIDNGLFPTLGPVPGTLCLYACGTRVTLGMCMC